MPAPATADDFLACVHKSGVLEHDRLQSFVNQKRASGRLPGEPRQLAESMIQEGLLTGFQADQFLQGKYRRFTIGKYKILEPLGIGGMGTVYLCEQSSPSGLVAVKLLSNTSAQDASLLKRFYREARAGLVLDHPNIVRTYELGQDDKYYFLVMEYVDGSELKKIVKERGPLSVVRACHYIRQAAQGLQYAHVAGVIHRDIKPGNLMLDRSGRVKILDMGLALFFEEGGEILTRGVLGTADYLAPEQCLDSHGVDNRADIYSLGGTFFYLLTGRSPFGPGTTSQKLIWHRTKRPDSVRSLRPEVPAELEAVIEKMMAKNPADRYQTPQAVADALAPWTRQPISLPTDEEMPRRNVSGPSPFVQESSSCDTPISLAPTAAPVAEEAAQPAPVAAPASRTPAPRNTPSAAAWSTGGSNVPTWEAYQKQKAAPVPAAPPIPSLKPIEPPASPSSRIPLARKAAGLAPVSPAKSSAATWTWKLGLLLAGALGGIAAWWALFRS